MNSYLTVIETSADRLVCMKVSKQFALPVRYWNLSKARYASQLVIGLFGDAT